MKFDSSSKADKIEKYYRRGYNVKKIIQKGKRKFCQSYAYRIISIYEEKIRPKDKKEKVIELKS